MKTFSNFKRALSVALVLAMALAFAPAAPASAASAPIEDDPGFSITGSLNGYSLWVKDSGSPNAYTVGVFGGAVDAVTLEVLNADNTASYLWATETGITGLDDIPDPDPDVNYATGTSFKLRVTPATLSDTSVIKLTVDSINYTFTFARATKLTVTATTGGSVFVEDSEEHGVTKSQTIFNDNQFHMQSLGSNGTSVPSGAPKEIALTGAGDVNADQRARVSFKAVPGFHLETLTIDGVSVSPLTGFTALQEFDSFILLGDKNLGVTQDYIVYADFVSDGDAIEIRNQYELAYWVGQSVYTPIEAITVGAVRFGLGSLTLTEQFNLTIPAGSELTVASGSELTVECPLIVEGQLITEDGGLIVGAGGYLKIVDDNPPVSGAKITGDLTVAPRGICYGYWKVDGDVTVTSGAAAADGSGVLTKDPGLTEYGESARRTGGGSIITPGTGIYAANGVLVGPYNSANGTGATNRYPVNNSLWNRANVALGNNANFIVTANGDEVISYSLSAGPAHIYNAAGYNGESAAPIRRPFIVDCDFIISDAGVVHVRRSDDDLTADTLTTADPRNTMELKGSAAVTSERAGLGMNVYYGARVVLDVGTKIVGTKAGSVRYQDKTGTWVTTITVTDYVTGESDAGENFGILDAEHELVEGVINHPNGTSTGQGFTWTGEKVAPPHIAQLCDGDKLTPLATTTSIAFNTFDADEALQELADVATGPLFIWDNHEKVTVEIEWAFAPGVTYDKKKSGDYAVVGTLNAKDAFFCPAGAIDAFLAAPVEGVITVKTDYAPYLESADGTEGLDLADLPDQLTLDYSVGYGTDAGTLQTLAVDFGTSDPRNRNFLLSTHYYISETQITIRKSVLDLLTDDDEGETLTFTLNYLEADGTTSNSVGCTFDLSNTESAPPSVTTKTRLFNPDDPEDLEIAFSLGNGKQAADDVDAVELSLTPAATLVLNTDYTVDTTEGTLVLDGTALAVRFTDPADDGDYEITITFDNSFSPDPAVTPPTSEVVVLTVASSGIYPKIVVSPSPPPTSYDLDSAGTVPFTVDFGTSPAGGGTTGVEKVSLALNNGPEKVLTVTTDYTVSGAGVTILGAGILSLEPEAGDIVTVTVEFSNDEATTDSFDLRVYDSSLPAGYKLICGEEEPVAGNLLTRKITVDATNIGAQVTYDDGLYVFAVYMLNGREVVCVSMPYYEGCALYYPSGSFDEVWVIVSTGTIPEDYNGNGVKIIDAIFPL